MKKILITLVLVVLLIGFAIAIGGQINGTINMSQNAKNTLASLGIINPVISPCVEIDNRTCKANVYQKGGINKQIEIETSFCQAFHPTEIGVCLNWKTLNQNQIESAMQDELKELLEGIAEVQEERTQSKIIITDGIDITIE